MTHNNSRLAAAPMFRVALSLCLSLGLGGALAQTSTLAQTNTPARPAAVPAKPAVTTPTTPMTQMQLGAVVTTVTPELMLATLQSAGYAVKLDKSGDNPEITLSRKNSVDIYLNFHNCKTGSCTEMDAYTYYAAEDLKTQPAESDMATWNSKHYTQAYIDGSDEDSVNLDSLYRFTGGFTRANFLNWLNEFRKDADSFDRMLDNL